MHILSQITYFSNFLDALAIACSLMMIAFLFCNRRKYGRMILNKSFAQQKDGFTEQVALQMMSQQSQKAYDNLVLVMTKEFEALRLLSEGVVAEKTGLHFHQSDQLTLPTGNERQLRYRMAEKMISRGEDIHQIHRQCGLSEGEFELLHGLAQLEKANA